MKILIADDHRLIVEAVADKLKELTPDLAVCTAFSVDELHHALDASVALALIDLGMPGARGVEHISEAHRRWPGLKIIVLSGAQDEAVVRAAMEAGAQGFIPKAHSPEAMLMAVQTVLGGGTYLPWQLMPGTAPAPERASDEALDRFKLGAVPVTDTHEAQARLAGVRAEALAAQTDLQLKRQALADSTALAPDSLSARLPAGALAEGGASAGASKETAR